MYFGALGVFCLAYGIFTLSSLPVPPNDLKEWYTTLYPFLMALFNITTSIGIFMLKPWSRIMGIILMVITMLVTAIRSMRDIYNLNESMAESWVIYLSSFIVLAGIVILGIGIRYLGGKDIKTFFR